MNIVKLLFLLVIPIFDPDFLECTVDGKSARLTTSRWKEETGDQLGQTREISTRGDEKEKRERVKIKPNNK